MVAQRPNPGSEHIIEGLVVVAAEDINRASKLLASSQVSEEVVNGYLTNMGADEAGQIKETLGFITVANPHRATLVLETQGIAGSPVHAVGYESHAGFMSGAGPDPTEKSLDPVDHGHSEQIIAVIDSGLSDTRPGWMAGRNVWHSPADHEVVSRDGASHGTFVTSLLRQVAPEFVVSFAAAKPVQDGVFKDPASHFSTHRPTTELDVLGAIYRLVQRHRNAPWKVKALNLSLGVVACSHPDPFHLTLVTALKYWLHHMGDNAPIFAAGGNRSTRFPVFPAAYGGVRSVAAGGERGNQKVWDQYGRPATDNGRDWITDVSPGVGVVGLSGRDKRHTVSWSGSSFATAIATACSVSGARFDVAGGITYWCDRSLSKAAHRATFD